MRKTLFVVSMIMSSPIYAQDSNPATAADYAARGQRSAQEARTTHDANDFFAACSNILAAVSLEPTNQDYLVAATTYLDFETRFTSRKQLDGYKYAEQAIQLSNGENARAYFHAAKALDDIGSPAKAFAYAQEALKLGLAANDAAAAQKLVKALAPRKTILWNVLDLQEIQRDGTASGGADFYYPVPPSAFFNQTAEYQVFGASRWDKVESDGDTFLRIWIGSEETIEIRIVVSRFRSYRKVIVEDHSMPLPLEAAAYTNSTSYIDATSPEIQAAATIVKRTNWVETIAAIRDYVYNGWNYVATGTSSKSSTTLLKTRTGMCKMKQIYAWPWRVPTAFPPV